MDGAGRPVHLRGMSRRTPILPALRSTARPGAWLGALLLVAGLLVPAAAHASPGLLCADGGTAGGEPTLVCETLLASVAPATADAAPPTARDERATLIVRTGAAVAARVAERPVGGRRARAPPL